MWCTFKLLALVVVCGVFTPTYAAHIGWDFSIPSSSSGAFTAAESTGSATVLGNFTRLAHGFLKFDVTGSTGSATPANGTLKFGIEVPGFALYTEPFLTFENKVINATSGGFCPTATWTGIMLYYLWQGTSGTAYDVSAATTPAFGVFSWNPFTNQATISDLRNLTSYATLSGFTSFNLSGSCNAGEITFTGAGDRGGTMYMSSSQGGIYATQTGRAIYVLPQVTIPAASNLNGTYTAFVMDESVVQDIKGIRITVAGGTTGTGDQLSDIESNTADTTKTWSFSSITINTPVNGTFTADLALEGGTATKAVCAVYFRTNTVFFCAAQNPATSSRPLNFVMVSDAQAMASGSLDSYLFSADGKANAEILSGHTDDADDMALLPDGKIVIAGHSRATGSDRVFSAVRYNIDGTLDTSFSTDGMVSVDFTSRFDEGRAIAVASDGSVIIAGLVATTNSSNHDWGLVKLASSGALDTTFDTDGMVFLSWNTGLDEAQAVAIQSDGKIVAAGYTTSGTANFALARFLTNGALDTTFDSDGKYSRDFGALATADVARRVLVAADGSLYAVGYANSRFAVMKLSSAGALDTSWDSDGELTTSMSSSTSQALGAALDASNRLVVCGYATGSTEDFGFARYLTSGALDTTFDTDGKAVYTVGSAADRCQAVALQTDGKIVGAGYRTAGNNDFALIRLTTSGALDTTFDSDGRVTATFNGNAEDASAVAVQSDGKIVAAGGMNPGSLIDFGVMRFWP